MCGIAGAVFWGDDALDPSPVVAAMTDALSHRGPDGRGLVTCAGSADGAGVRVALGHTRLAIIDLSEAGAQPMRRGEPPLYVTFNGEIYNFASLRRQLEAGGERFRSNSDTEVLLAGYERWAGDVFSMLRGMFAAAIWDARRNRLALVRDRLGIKPLYVYRGDRRVLFASEIGALLASGLVPRRLDRESLDQYLAYQTVAAPRTLVQGVSMMLPGHVATLDLDAGGWSDRTYWELLDSRSPDAAAADAGEARRKVRALLEEAAALHLVSDVPVGIFLSGGIDSSALVALTRAAGVTPRTFSVVLPGSHQDESVFARTVAGRFAAEHTEIAVGERDFRDEVTQALARVDHPSGDGLNTYVVSKAVRASGISVALSGLGGDELFGGYPSFQRLRRLSGYAAAWGRSPRSVRSAAAAAVRTVGRDSVASTKAAAVLEGDGSIAQAFPILRQLFSASQREALLGAASLGADPYVTVIADAAARHPGGDVMSLVSFAEARTYMHDVLLRDTDQMSMAHALEVRVPFLDHVLVEYVMGLREEIKRPGVVPKRLLVESLDGCLPPEIVHRPKQGFVLPFNRWMKADLRALCELHLGEHGLEGRGIFRPEALRGLWRSFLAGDRRTTWSRPWTLVALDAWMSRFGIAA